MNPSKGLFRRRPSSASTASGLRSRTSSLSAAVEMARIPSAAITVKSCPASPRKHLLSPQNTHASRRSLGDQRIPEDEEFQPTTSTEAIRLEQQQKQQEKHLPSPLQPQLKNTKSRSLNTVNRIDESLATRRLPTPSTSSLSRTNFQRSTSLVAGLNSRPAGLFSYTGKFLNYYTCTHS